MKIYIVIGRTGEYSDANEWPVCWKRTREAADELVAKLTAEADAFKEWDRSCDSDDHWQQREKRMKAMTDPHFACDYTGTSYYTWTVGEEPGETK